MPKPFVLAALIVFVVSIDSLKASESPSATVQDRWFAPAMQLGAESFRRRRTALRQLEIAGAGASSALAKAVLRGNREAARAAYAMLSQRLQSTSPELQASSELALHTIAVAKHSIYASRALKLLEAEEVFQRQASRPIADLPAFLQGVEAIEFNVRNGNQELRIDEVSRRVTINRTPAGAVTIQIDPIVGGDKKSQVVSARNSAELRTSDPQMYALYCRFAPLLSSRPGFARSVRSEVAPH